MYILDGLLGRELYDFFSFYIDMNLALTIKTKTRCGFVIYVLIFFLITGSFQAS